MTRLKLHSGTLLQRVIFRTTLYNSNENIQPPIHFPPLMQFRVTAGLKPITAVKWYTPDRSAIYHRLKPDWTSAGLTYITRNPPFVVYTPTFTLESPVNPTSMSLDCGEEAGGLTGNQSRQGDHMLT